MIAGGWGLSKRTLPVRSPWMSWLGAVTGRSAETSSGKCRTSGNSLAGISPQATRSLIAHRLNRWSRKDGRGIPRKAAWKRSPAAMISGQRRASCVPVTYSVAHHPSTHSEPSAARRGRASRKPAEGIWEKIRACHASSSRSPSAGLKTTSPANQDVPCPPLSRTGRDPATSKAASTADGGTSTSKTYPTRPHRGRAGQHVSSVLAATPLRRHSRVFWVSSASSGPGDCRGSRERKNNGDRPAAHVKGAGNARPKGAGKGGGLAE